MREIKRITRDGLDFVLHDDGTAGLVGFQSEDDVSYISIPESVEGYPVTSIHCQALIARRIPSKGPFGPRIPFKNLQTIRIPVTVKQIWEDAFPIVKQVPVDEAYYQKCVDITSGRAGLPRCFMEDCEAFENAQIALSMMEYRNVYAFTAIVKAGSYAEAFCKKNHVPYRIE